MIFKIAIIGAGPAGYFTALAFQKSQTEDRMFEIDLIERLPTPGGLVRFGVSPDHPKIKTVSKVFEKIAKSKGFRLFCNVELGKDVSLKDLREVYDVVVLATGVSTGRKLGINGEDLLNCFSAGEFIPWYNSHPDFKDLSVNLDFDTAVVIGAGNVALDVARMLAVNPSELIKTDIAEHAIKVFKSSNVRNIILCGRRGPEHATFTAHELRNLLKLENTGICLDSDQINQAFLRVGQNGELDNDLKNNLEVMSLIAKQNEIRGERKIELKFLASLKEIKGDGKVEEAIFTINEVKDGKIVAGNKTFKVKTGLVITAIGYDTIQYPGVKFENGRIANIAGHVDQNIYVTGWAKRGPVGVIGTNKSDSSDVVSLILKNLKEPKNCKGIDALLKSGHKVVNQVGWEKIDAYELISGELNGKSRSKVADWHELLKLGTF